VGRLAAITRKLLLLSQADAGYLALQLAPIDLSATLNEMAADAQMLIVDADMLLPEKVFQCSIARGLLVQGDALLLRQLFNNLLSNALRYCRAGGWIKLAARTTAGGVEVVFANATQPIDQAQRQRFFERFYRGDAAHNRSIDGNGLGLSLAQEIARAHGGELTLLPSANDEVHLRLVLPTVKSTTA
jgi:two-component system, OmpR family, heavy metal sensor histidine kinase CusS